jgi:hypothetical protein
MTETTKNAGVALQVLLIVAGVMALLALLALAGMLALVLFG